jgi:predicted ATPase
VIISHITLKNWRNFLSINVPIGKRAFLVGPNASGKSNLLDALRFLRDIAKPHGGGLQKAVQDRGGISKIRCLSARKDPNIEIEVRLSDYSTGKALWKYAISIKQESRGHRNPYLEYERVWEGEKLLLDRPDEDDQKDELRLTQTNLEQINANMGFRDIVKFFDSIYYLHLVPQLLRHSEYFTGPAIPEDPFGGNFLERVMNTPEKTRRARLKKIESTLHIAVPQLEQLTDTRDRRGIPHLEALFKHWRPDAGKQTEKEFSDGTLRLIGLFWSLLEGDSLLLLEEPELSLNAAIVSRLPEIMWKLQNNKKRQIIVSTHSVELLSNKGIGGEEVLLLQPDAEGTKVKPASSIEEIRALLEGGMSVAEAVMPLIEPENIVQLSLFNE